jgi:hypothetical protein
MDAGKTRVLANAATNECGFEMRCSHLGYFER